MVAQGCQVVVFQQAEEVDPLYTETGRVVVAMVGQGKAVDYVAQLIQAMGRRARCQQISA